MQESQEALEKRIAALERTITEGEGEYGALADGAATAERVETLEERLDDLTDQVGELDAATQALRGYVGNIRSVNREVEQRADAALAKVESLDSQQGQQTQTAREERSCPRCGRTRADGTDGTDGPDGTDGSGGSNGDQSPDRAHGETRVWRDRKPRETEAGQGRQIRDGTETARDVAFDGEGSRQDPPDAGVNGETGGVIGRVRDLL